MEMKKTQGILSWVVVLSELSHVFCCVLPGLFSVLSVLVGMGVVGVMPLWMSEFHHIMHDWEVPLMISSGVVMTLGWTLHIISRRMDCHDTGCVHEPCTPKKKHTARILTAATVLFTVNLAVYVFLHP